MARASSCRGGALGAMLGLAVADALNVHRQATPGASLSGFGAAAMHPGSWGDDTAMAVALASSLIECGGWNDKDFAERLAAWLTHGEYSYSGSPGRFHGGLRSGCEWLAPVAIRFWQDRQALGAATIGQARVGRASASAAVSGWFLAEMLADAIAGEPPGKLPRSAGIRDRECTAA